MGIKDIGYYVSVLNSREVEVYEFLLYGRGELNSWDGLGEVLFSAFSGELDLRGGVLFRERYDFNYYCGVLNSLLIKYLSLCDGVEYTFRFLDERVYNINFNSSSSNASIYSIKFTKEDRDDFINKNPYPVGILANFSGCIISNIDRGIGLMDIDVMGICIRFHDVMVEGISLVSFSYGGRVHKYGVRGLSWLQYDNILDMRRNQSQVPAISTVRNLGVDNDFGDLVDLPF